MSQSALDTHAEVRKLKQAGCPEEQAEAMVNLVSRAPLNAQIAGGLEQVQLRLESIEATMVTKSELQALSLRVESIEATMAGLAPRSAVEALSLRVESIEATMATKSDLAVLGAETRAALKDLRSEMFRMIWLQGGALATLILGLALS
ncbi:MAG: hypothetical protein OXC70_03555 [Gammaproteobacteria bacterium]|nr:hypothetical protein [Gammaproteobacteria bacterium]